jgi:hypothetical protein
MRIFLSILTIAAVAALLMAGDPALAISRYNSTSMSCEAVQRAIGREGAIILRYPSSNKPGLTLYDRYVIHSGFCDDQDFADRVTVPTADTPRCPVRACKLRDRDDCSLFRHDCRGF